LEKPENCGAVLANGLKKSFLSDEVMPTGASAFGISLFTGEIWAAFEGATSEARLVDFSKWFWKTDKEDTATLDAA
jgi:hypothetical protein